MSEFIVQGETYQMIDPSKVTFAEADAIERTTGHTFQQIQGDDAVSGSARVIQALLWVSMKRAKPELKFSDLNDLAFGDIEWPEVEESEADPTEAEDAPSAA